MIGDAAVFRGIIDSLRSILCWPLLCTDHFFFSSASETKGLAKYLEGGSFGNAFRLHATEK